MESGLLRRAVAPSAGTRIRDAEEDYDVDTEAVIGQAGSSKDKMEMCTGVSYPTEVLRNSLRSGHGFSSHGIVPDSHVSRTLGLCSA